MTLRNCFLLTLWAATAAFGQVSSLPQTPAGERLSGWLEAFNSKDLAAIRDFNKAHYPKSPVPAEGVIQFANQTGGFEVMQVLESAPHSISVLVRARSMGRFARLVLDTAPAGPHNIVSARIMPTKRPPEYAPARLSEEEAIAALKAEAARLAANYEFSGAIAVTKKGQFIFTAAHGMADRAIKKPNRVDTRFRIGSMNKMFTATASLQLVQAGKLALTDPVGKYLPDYPNADLAAKVTIHHLLTHTGGTGDIFGPQFNEKRLELRELGDYVGLYGERGLKFEPGARFEYSNYGYLLLGVIIERVSGRSYYQYVRENIFKPAGMGGTDSLPESEPVEGRSEGYMRGPGADWRPNTDTLPVRGTSAGGGYSTVEELTHFAEALLRHKLLNAYYTDLLTAGKVDAGGDRYAYGFFDRTSSDGVRFVGHGGGAPGMNGELQIFSGSGYTVAVLANIDPPAAERIAEYISDRLPMQTPAGDRIGEASSRR
jgi:D-alanyl-D-alanine carboxypeptidase